MARISGVDLPRNKSISIALSYIYGIGRFQSKKILDAIGIDYSIKTGDLSEEQILLIRNEIDDNFIISSHSFFLMGITESLLCLMSAISFNINYIITCMFTVQSSNVIIN